MSIEQAFYGAHSVDVNAGLTANADAAVAAKTGLRLTGYSCRESDGTPAVASAQIVHGATGAGGTSVIPISLAASTGHTVDLGAGIACDSGISINHGAGTLDINIFYKIV